jgi:hypothetical protein
MLRLLDYLWELDHDLNDKVTIKSTHQNKLFSGSIGGIPYCVLKRDIYSINGHREYLGISIKNALIEVS